MECEWLFPNPVNSWSNPQTGFMATLGHAETVGWLFLSNLLRWMSLSVFSGLEREAAFVVVVVVACLRGSIWNVVGGSLRSNAESGIIRIQTRWYGRCSLEWGLSQNVPWERNSGGTRFTSLLQLNHPRTFSGFPPLRIQRVPSLPRTLPKPLD